MALDDTPLGHNFGGGGDDNGRNHEDLHEFVSFFFVQFCKASDAAGMCTACAVANLAAITAACTLDTNDISEEKFFEMLSDGMKIYREDKSDG